MSNARMEPAEADGNPWRGIQAAFVDDPRAALEQADGLVAQLLTEHLKRLRGSWQRAEPAPTEELRLALQRYRVLAEDLAGSSTAQGAGPSAT